MEYYCINYIFHKKAFQNLEVNLKDKTTARGFAATILAMKPVGNQLQVNETNSSFNCLAAGS
jgi:hypothetical protein